MNIIAAIVRTFGPAYVANMSNPFGVGGSKHVAKAKSKAKPSRKASRKKLRRH